jgi:hypothetical protein
METLTQVMNIIAPFAIVIITAFGVVVWSVITEMRKEMKAIAEVAYTAKAKSEISEERRKAVEHKLDDLVIINRELINEIKTMRNEINEISKAQAVADAKRPSPRRANG